MGLLGQMTVRFGGDTSGLNKAAGQAKNTLSGFSMSSASIANGVTGALGLATAAIIGVGVVSTKMAGDFESATTTLVTGAGELQSNLGMVRQGILNLATDTGTSTKQLIDGMFMIESAGYHGAAGLAVLSAAARGARVGNADLGVVADATTTILADFKDKNYTASQAVNALIATVQNGKTKMQDLAGALSQILPTASAAKIGLTDVMGAMATMTGEGVPAANAATYLRQTILALEAPSAGAIKALKSIGLSSSDVAKEMQKSLPDALKMITDALAKKFPVGSAAYIQALKNISGGSKTMQGMLDLTGQHLSTFEANVKSVGNSVTNGKDKIMGWALVQSTFNQKMDKAREVVETLMIKIGSALLPVLGRLLDKVTPAIEGFTKWLTEGNRLQNAMQALSDGINNVVTVGTNVVNFFKNNQAALVGLIGVVILLAGAIGGILVFSLYSMAVAAWAALVPMLPFILIGAAIAGVIALIVLAVMHWGEIAHWLQGIWGGFTGWLKGIWGGFTSWFMGVLGAIGNFFKNIWNGIVNFGKAAWNFLVNAAKAGAAFLLAVILGPFIAIGALFIWLYNHNTYFKALIDAIVNFVRTGVKWLQDTWTGIVNWIVGKWTQLKEYAIVYFTLIYFVIYSKILQVENFVHGILVSIGNFFISKWNDLVTLASNLWGKISAIFSSAWNTYIAGPLGSLWNNISSWWNNTVVGGFLSFGGKIMQALADGIKNAAGFVGNAIHNVISGALNGLGFHNIPGFASGVQNFAGGFAVVGERGPELLYLPTGSNVYPSGTRPSGSASASSSSTGGGGDQTIQIILDSTMLAETTGSKQARLVRLKQGRRAA